MPADLRVLSSVRQLAKVTCSREDVIDTFLATPDAHVERVVIPRHGSSRAPREAWKITTPDVTAFLGMLRLELDAFLRRWFAERYPHACVHGYIAKRSALTNARLHAGRRSLLHVDVKDFFPSIRTSTIRDALLRLGFMTKGAELVAKVVTREGALPLGYPTSPICSNVVLMDADERLAALAETAGATYTRYADDLTISGDGKLPTRAEVADILRTIGLEIHPTKSRERKQGQALYVTGYSVSDVAARAPRPLKRRLRQELYYTRKYGFADHLNHEGRGSVTNEYDRIVGQIEHVRYVEPSVGDELLASWDARPQDGDGSHTRAALGTATQVFLLFDDSSFPFFKSEHRALGTVLLREYETTKERLQELIADFMLNAIMPDHARERVRAKGLHFNELPADFRRDAIELAARVPARAHIVFDTAVDSKKEQMAKFLRAALKWRLGDCRGKLVTVVFEEGEYIKKRDAEGLVQTAFDALPAHQRPLRIDDIRVVGKLEEPCVALPDIFLGAWQQFACDNEPDRKKNRERDELLFRSVQSRIGTIFRPSTRELFTSRNPFPGLAPPSPSQAGGSSGTPIPPTT